MPPTLISPGETVRRARNNHAALTEIIHYGVTRKFSVGEALALAEALRHNTTVTRFYGDAFEPGALAESLPAIAEAMKQAGSAINLVNLEKSVIGPGGAAAIADALAHSASLKVLFLEQSGVGDDGAAAIAGALKRNRSLRVLSLCGCGIGDAGATAIADALKYNDTLTGLHLLRNRIGVSGAAAIASAMKFHNHSIATISLDFEHEFEADFDEIADHMTMIVGYAEVNRKYSAMDALARKTGLILKLCLRGAIEDYLLPKALERVARTGSLSVMFDFLREKHAEVVAGMGRRNVGFWGRVFGRLS